MTALWPKSWAPNVARLLPRDPARYSGAMIAFWLTALYLVAITVRSCIHLFSADGGAQSIATIDTDVAGGTNIVAVFAQWGATQLLLALLVEPFLRALAGHLKPLETIGTPPGVALNWYAVPVLAVMLYLALCPADE